MAFENSEQSESTWVNAKRVGDQAGFFRYNADQKDDEFIGNEVTGTFVNLAVAHDEGNEQANVKAHDKLTIRLDDGGTRQMIKAKLNTWLGMTIAHRALCLVPGEEVKIRCYAGDKAKVAFAYVGRKDPFAENGAGYTAVEPFDLGVSVATDGEETVRATLTARLKESKHHYQPEPEKSE